MTIPAYQIRNILHSYAKLLCGEENCAGREAGSLKFARKYRLNAEGKRRMVVRRVVDDIIEKITSVESRESKGPRSFPRPAAEKDDDVQRPRVRADKTETYRFTYYKIEEDGVKRKSSSDTDK